jgi:hypothetical protein
LSFLDCVRNEAFGAFAFFYLRVLFAVVTLFGSRHKAGIYDAIFFRQHALRLKQLTKTSKQLAPVIAFVLFQQQLGVSDCLCIRNVIAGLKAKELYETKAIHDLELRLVITEP